MSSPADVRVSPEGHILLDGTRLYQAHAVVTALRLLMAVQESIHRNQPRPATLDELIRRDESPLGRAIRATRNTNYEGVWSAWVYGIERSSA